MTPTTILPAISFNWYDAVVLLALVFGLWMGVRRGLSGELLRVFGLVLMAALTGATPLLQRAVSLHRLVPVNVLHV
jgi:uncharacterized membrane protein required for colicin V production